MTADSFGDQIIRHATMFTGLKEVRQNREWDNPQTPEIDRVLSDLLRREMEKSGWESGAPYCAAFAEAVYRMAWHHCGGADDAPGFVRFKKLMTPHVVTSFKNFKAAGLIHRSPAAGAIWFARKRGTSSGHAGIVISVPLWSKPPRMINVEGNTTFAFESAAKDREGDGIARRERDQFGKGSLETLGWLWCGDVCNALGQTREP